MVYHKDVQYLHNKLHNPKSRNTVIIRICIPTSIYLDCPTVTHDDVTNCRWCEVDDIFFTLTIACEETGWA
jgi:hypothetical protein